MRRLVVTQTAVKDNQVTLIIIIMITIIIIIMGAETIKRTEMKENKKKVPQTNEKPSRNEILLQKNRQRKK